MNLLFGFLIFFLPTQLSLHFWPADSFIYGIRVDYLSPALYFTDVVLLVFTIVFFINKKNRQKFYSSHALWILLVIFFFSFFNTTLSTHPLIAVFRWLKFLQIALLFLIIRSRKKSLLPLFHAPLSLSLVFLLVLSVCQIVNGGSLGGVFYWFGERSFTTQTTGIALASLNGSQLLRPYATLPHPNALSGYALVAFLFLATIVKKRSPLVYLGIISSLFIIVLTFSQNSWLALITLLGIFLLSRKFRLSIILKFVFATLVILSLLLPLLAFKLLLSDFAFPQNIEQRLYLAVLAKEPFIRFPLFGAGLGTFVYFIPEGARKLNEYGLYFSGWWLQPVHNMFLLILTECGLLGFLGTTYFSWRSIVNALKSTYWVLILAIVLTGFWDHYWITLQQTLLLAVIIFALATKDSFGTIRKHE